MKKWIIQCAIVFFSFSSFFVHAAFDLKGEVTGGNLRWDNVTKSGSDMVPSMWETPSSLQTTTSWIPATFSIAPVNSIILTGDGGDTSAAIDISVTGMQYNTTGINFSESSNTLGGACSVDNVSLPIITVQGDSCVSSSTLTSTTSIAPFVFFRPVFSIGDAEIIGALSGLPEGIYSGMVPINIRYYYESFGGAITYRNVNEVIMFSIEYSPVEISSVNVIGDGVMSPVYDTTTKRISSETDYDITVNGYFNNGIVLTMPIKDYELINSTDATVKIPYSITCQECSDLNLVDDDGVLVNEVTSIGQGTGNQTSIPFTLSFKYDVKGDSLLSGDYNDLVIIMLEPGI
ncbi:hypothetical protein [Aliivibrio logei]|uniref:Adhesin n=1 Tax=Aliivibrio logei 5S-186 TaxID=626086 RepID=A0ABX3B0J2_ALILO|nr:hypothetical protein [Aliivibrio logei]OEF22524.1 hypothetical protein A1Q5_15725 [Aliivibrio logei 5S-186]